MTTMEVRRRAQFVLIACSLWTIPHATGIAQEAATDESVTRPVISEDVAPLIPIEPVASDGHRGEGYMRRPPGDGPYPAVVFVHGGLSRRPTDYLQGYSRRAHPSRFLADGFVVAVITYRSRDVDPQSSVSSEDVLAAVEFLKELPYVDPQSVVVRGTSGGGDLALEVAAMTGLAAIIAEEPATMLFTGVMNTGEPKAEDTYSPRDSLIFTDDPWRYYTEERQEFTREKLQRIGSPILIVQGTPFDRSTPTFRPDVNRFNAAVLIPELYAAGKEFDVHTYSGEPHSFAFYSEPARTPRPAVALEAYEAMIEWLMPHLSTKPVPIEPSLIQYTQWP